MGAVNGRLGSTRARLTARVAGAVVLAVVATGLASPAPASAGVAQIQFGVVPTFPDPVTVGQANVPVSVVITNQSVDQGATQPVTLTSIRLVPSCSNFNTSCAGGIADPGTFTLSPTAAGRAGTACAGFVFNVVVVNPATGEVQFTPQGGTVVLGVPNTPTSTCAIDFTLSVFKVPNADSFPAVPGVQTNQVAHVEGFNESGAGAGQNDGTDVVTVNQGVPTLATQATPTVSLGIPISDTATVTGGASSAAPTGTVTFSVFGPNDPTCAGPPAFTSANRPLGGGPPSATATSSSFMATLVGTYRWIANYSGDANYTPATGVCNAPNEISVVTHNAPTLVTQATPTATIGQSLTDTATLSNALNATGTITFRVFGPNDATCAGAPVFTSAPAVVNGNGSYTSGSFTPSATGTYRWVATYSGDANNIPVVTACNDANETSVVTQAEPTIAPQATPTTPLGGPISDTVTVAGPAGAPAPTGAVTFTLFGADDATCTGPAIFTSTVPLSGGPPPSATSDSFTPAQPGTYRWVATYSGDANYASVPVPCNSPNQTSVVTAPSPIAVFRPSNAVWFFHNGPTLHWGTQGDIAVPADYNGDGVEDIAVFRPSNGVWFVRGGVTAHWGTAGDIPVPADYDGDGDDDIAVFRPSTGYWFVLGGPTLQFGTSSDIPVPADYDGSGSDDIAIFRPILGLWLLATGGGTQFGIIGDVPVPADYNGDGTDEVAVYRQITGSWHLQSGASFNWGASGDVPVPADYDNNGTTDIAVFRPSSGVWFIRNGPTVAWGTNGDDPLPLPAAVREAYFP